MASYMEIDIRVELVSYRFFNENFPYQPGCTVVRSSDDMYFALDVDRLRVVTGQTCFDASYSMIPGVADLSYSAYILEKLFLCLNPTRFPSFDDMTVSELVVFGKAATEFRIQSAIALTFAYLKQHIHKHPKDVLAYAVWCGHSGLVKEVASTDYLNAPLSEVAQILPDPFFRTWISLYIRDMLYLMRLL
ncbi:hypothetical protein C8R42DRAFT_644035 [Lentinula raphanica]|nr:hypothetical protein C8R42DRAFT_644035 [Lentinula raphanica]